MFSGGNFLKKTGQKCSFWAFFGKLLHIGLFKITTNWPPLDERVRSSFAESCKKYSQNLQNLIIFHGFYVQKIIHYFENKKDYNRLL